MLFSSQSSLENKSRSPCDQALVVENSFGGATAAQFCHDDPRCKAGIDVDGAPFGSVGREGLHQPFMFLLSDQSHGSDDGAVLKSHIVLRTLVLSFFDLYRKGPR